MDAEKEQLIKRYLDEHRRMVDREREFALLIAESQRRFEELRETGKKVDEDYANTKQKLTAFMVRSSCPYETVECRAFHRRGGVRPER